MIYGITMRSPGGWRRWLVRIEVRQYPAAVAGEAARERTAVLLAVETFNEHGLSQQAMSVAVPADDLEHGLYPGCLVGLAPAWTERTEGSRRVISFPLLTDEQKATVARSLATLTSLFRLASAELKPIVDTVVARPPLAEIILHGGVVQLTIRAGLIGGTEVASALPGIPGTVCSFPFDVLAYETPALRGRLFVTDSRPPLLPGGGIVAVEASHPERPDSTVSIRLLSARRGAREARRQ